ncbi:hypothetical protein DFH07DRAFT_425681 [Mycena maculata]|uniref:F-box domain-containing protein n=1 Tax=Mycena maculata TaxID=230809 RepID=A0AAD7JEI6_9AGAR|nr:hypothetical protein DFH07DRAFT_425681 [Mycena maculata]
MFHIPELTDQVIDHLHADPASLRNCALVSRSWVPASQYHIFFSVNIKKDRTCRLLCDMITRSPHIGWYIRNIYIYFEVTRPSFVSLAALRVPEPRRLSIVNCPHTEELALIRHLICLPSLTDIRFFSGTSVSRAQLDYLAQTRTTKLGSLLLYSASDTPAPEDKEWASSPQPLGVSALNVSGDVTLVTHTLIDPHGPINLRNVEALTFDTNDISCLQKLLRICGADLVVLELLISTGAPPYNHALHLPALTRTADCLASHVHIGRSTIPYLIDLLLYDITTESLPAVLHLLAQLAPAAALRTLRLAPRDADVSSPFAPTPANRVLWTAIDHVLDALDDLVALEVDDVWAMDPEVGAHFVACFPNLVRKQVLNVRPWRAQEDSLPPSPPSSHISVDGPAE